ncbi:MAG: retropepsin-like domain-containing protein [Bryobacterales bacterium]|nr:retropepsin-like domain-containing protein [Bryobacterales bacterium]
MITRRHFAALLAPAAWAQPDLQALYDAHDWLGLAQAVTPASPLLMRGTAAAALHRYKEAERLLLRAAREGSAGDPHSRAIEAHAHLISLYSRAGRWRNAFASVQAAQRLAPNRPDFQNASALFGALARHPGLRPRRIRPTRLQCAAPGKLIVPITVNGQPARYFWDTGANFSLTTESEARRLGMTIESPNAQVSTATGGAVAFRLAIARTLAIGGCLIEHVPFMIFGDDQQPFDELPQQERGGIALPVQLALGSLRWDSTGNFDVASPDTPAGTPNSLLSKASCRALVSASAKRNSTSSWTLAPRPATCGPPSPNASPPSSPMPSAKPAASAASAKPSKWNPSSPPRSPSASAARPSPSPPPKSTSPKPTAAPSATTAASAWICSTNPHASPSISDRCV